MLTTCIVHTIIFHIQLHIRVIHCEEIIETDRAEKKSLGTHDNPTTLQWWKKKTSSKERNQFLEYIARPIEGEKESVDGYQLNKHVDKHICWYFIQLLFQSAANGAIVQIQDLLDVEIRFNEPGIGR